MRQIGNNISIGSIGNIGSNISELNLTWSHLKNS